MCLWQLQASPRSGIRSLGGSFLTQPRPERFAAQVALKRFAPLWRRGRRQRYHFRADVIVPPFLGQFLLGLGAKREQVSFHVQNGHRSEVPYYDISQV